MEDECGQGRSAYLMLKKESSSFPVDRTKQHYWESADLMAPR